MSRELWTMPIWMEKFRCFITSPYGKTVEDWQNSGSNIEKDPISYGAKWAISAQISLLKKLHDEGLLKEQG